MNIFQKVLGTIFPPYKFSVLQHEQSKLFSAIILALPNEYTTIKNQFLSGRLYGLKDWDLFPDFKFVTLGYGENNIFKYKKHSQNFKIAGLQIFSERNNKFENIELLIRDNLIAGLKISNSLYQLDEFGSPNVKANNVIKTNFVFPPSSADIFYDKLDTKIKQMLGPDDLSEIDLNNRIYYTFLDLDDGNCLAVDKKWGSSIITFLTSVKITIFFPKIIREIFICQFRNFITVIYI